MKTPTYQPDNFDTLEPHIRRRHRLGIAQCDVAGAMRLHPATVCKYELGRVLRVSDEWAAAYAEAVDTLAEAKEGERQALQAALARLTPEQRRLLARSFAAKPSALLPGAVAEPLGV